MSSKDNSKKSKHSNNKKTKIIIKNPYIIIISSIIICILAIIIIISKGKNNTVNTGMELSKSSQEYTEIESTNEWKMENYIKEANYVDENLILSNEISDNDVEDNENSIANVNEIKYYIKVNIQANVVNIYKKDKDDKYTIPYKAMVCSTGTATPAAGNIYTMPNDKWNRSTWGAMVGGVYAQYYSRINGNILFHSVPYTKQKKSCLEYWEYDKLGTKASAGCIRLTVEDAKWIYNNCPPGTKVEFYASSDPGPFGKPTARKISDESSTIRGWDPTDPDRSNPWNNYNPNTTIVDDKNTTTQNNITNNTTTNNTVNMVTNNSTSNTTVKDSTNSLTNTTNDVVNETIDTNTLNNIIENTMEFNETEANIVEENNTTENETTGNSTDTQQ